jgi:hypothetical protein
LDLNNPDALARVQSLYQLELRQLHVSAGKLWTALHQPDRGIDPTCPANRQGLTENRPIPLSMAPARLRCVHMQPWS